MSLRAMDEYLETQWKKLRQGEKALFATYRTLDQNCKSANPVLFVNVEMRSLPHLRDNGRGSPSSPKPIPNSRSSGRNRRHELLTLTRHRRVRRLPGYQPSPHGSDRYSRSMRPQLNCSVRGQTDRNPLKQKRLRSWGMTRTRQRKKMRP